jgi:membrane protein implicated in regulation of membrane protease activity
MRIPEARSTGVAALVRRPAVVLADVTDRSGLVKLAGETWTARTRTPGEVLREGSDVVVLAIDGATAVVGPADRAAPPSIPASGQEPHQQGENC